MAYTTRKLKDLSSDEFFDFVFSLTPIMPALLKTEYVKARIGGKVNADLTAASIEWSKQLAKEDYDENAMEDVLIRLNAASVESSVKDIMEVLPVLTHKENRNALHEAIAILEQKSVEEIKAYPTPKILTIIKAMFADINFIDFLDYTEQPDAIES